MARSVFVSSSRERLGSGGGEATHFPGLIGARGAGEASASGEITGSAGGRGGAETLGSVGALPQPPAARINPPRSVAVVRAFRVVPVTSNMAAIIRMNGSIAHMSSCCGAGKAPHPVKPGKAAQGASLRAGGREG